MSVDANIGNALPEFLARQKNRPERNATVVCAHWKLLTDIPPQTDKTTPIRGVLALSGTTIKNRDFEFSRATIDIGFSVKDLAFDPNAALRPLTGAAPETSAAQLPSISGMSAQPRPIRRNQLGEPPLASQRRRKARIDGFDRASSGVSS